MFYKIAALALAGLMSSATAAFAMTGIGCPDLPEYYRAVGTIENGAGSCGMTMEEAKRILARGNSEAGAEQPATAPPRKARRKHHRRATPQQ